jgi:hypothetical protein
VFADNEIQCTAATGADWFWGDVNPYSTAGFRLEADPIDEQSFYDVVTNYQGAPAVFVASDGGATWAIPEGQTKLSGRLGPVNATKNQ